MLITDSQRLTQQIELISASPYIAVDTEFAREVTYYPKLCLVQIATPEICFAVDPLAPGIDLSPLYALLFDSKTTKIFHAARQDFETFYCITKQLPSPLFDTQLAAMLLGLGEQPGYAKLVEMICGVALDKTHQFVDWTRRPLPEALLAYALDDVRYLLTLYTHLRDLLSKQGRLSWLEEEQKYLLEPSLYENPPEEAWRRLPYNAIRSAHRLGLLKSIAAWREERAKALNATRRKILNNDTLMNIVKVAPKTLEELSPLVPLNPPLLEELYARIVSATPCKTESTASYALSPQAKAFSKTLVALRTAQAEMHGIEPALIASTSELKRFASQYPERSQHFTFLKSWRYEVFGRAALAAFDTRLHTPG